MDVTAPGISFDDAGRCNYCRAAQARYMAEHVAGEEGARRLEALAARVRGASAGKPYDCVIGVSGGVDSSYVAVLAKRIGLRPLAVHLDNGWDSELAVGNIERLLSKLDVDLYTHVVDWEEIKDLQRAYFAASVCNVEAVTDHAIFALLWRTAAKHGIPYILSGSNIATESILPTAWTYDSRDEYNLRRIHRKFGTARLKSYPTISALRFLYCVFVMRIRLVKPLNFIDYRKADVLKELSGQYGYVPYKRKHGESIFTRFFQECYLPEKFNFDKRKAHLSSLIVSGQLTRDEAIAKLSEPMFAAGERDQEMEYVRKKLGYTPEEIRRILAARPVAHREYGAREWMFSARNPLTVWIRSIAKQDQ